MVQNLLRGNNCTNCKWLNYSLTTDWCDNSSYRPSLDICKSYVEHVVTTFTEQKETNINDLMKIMNKFIESKNDNR